MLNFSRLLRNSLAIIYAFGLSINALSALLFEIVSLPAGQSETIGLTFTIHNSFTGTSLENVPEITLDDGDDLDSDPSIGIGIDENGNGAEINDDVATTLISIGAIP